MGQLRHTVTTILGSFSKELIKIASADALEGSWVLPLLSVTSIRERLRASSRLEVRSLEPGAVSPEVHPEEHYVKLWNPMSRIPLVIVVGDRRCAMDRNVLCLILLCLISLFVLSRICSLSLYLALSLCLSLLSFSCHVLVHN